MPPLRPLLLALAALAGLLATALPSAAAERRIALVVGNGAYAGSAIPTAANDAGLVAQTLQAAGFDVVGARDLDEESLRRSLRSDAVAFVYLSGYGLQLENEAYLAPVDARIETASDVPLQAVRISDYVKRLAALPLKARFVVLDAARTAPFRLRGDPLAGGLPLTEAEPGSLIAYNAAPGTVGPAETGPYGAYALALVEMIREGGLAPAALFERVRLRVAEATRGAEVPWSASRIEAPFVFLEREAGAPSLAGFAPPQKPLGEIGAREAYAACLGRDTLAGYEEFVAAYPHDPLAKRVRAIIAARREALTWRRSALANTPEAYWSYLGRYPRGPHAWDARRRLSALAAAFAPPPDYRVLAYDVPPPPPDEVIYVERPALYLDDPVYALPPPPVAFLPPRPTVLVELAPPPPPVEAYILPVPAYVPVPTYVVAPPAVVPPPNPVLFQNLHVQTITVVNERAPELAPPGASRPAPVAGQVVGQVAGTVAGAALGAAAARVALPPAIAQKAALRPDPQGALGQGAPGQGAPGQIPRAGGPVGGPPPGAAALRPSLPGQIPARGPAGPRPNPAQALPGAGGTPLPAMAGRPVGPPPGGRPVGLGQIPSQGPSQASGQTPGQAPGQGPGRIPPSAAQPAGPPPAVGRPGQPALAARPPQGPAAAAPPQGLQPQGVRPPVVPARPVQPPRMVAPAQAPRPAMQPLAAQSPRMTAPARAPRPDDGLQRMRMEQAVRQQAMQRQQMMQAQQAQARQRFEGQQMMQRQQQQMQDAMRRQQAQALRQPQMMAPRPQPMQPHPQAAPRPAPHAPPPGHGCGHPGGPPCR
jgi:uncharacterized caspase-like protein